MIKTLIQIAIVIMTITTALAHSTKAFTVRGHSNNHSTTVGGATVAKIVPTAHSVPVHAPYVMGTWKIVRSDNIIMQLDQNGDHISADFTTSARVHHILTGEWNDVTKCFDYKITRTNLNNGATTDMYGHLFVDSFTDIRTHIVGTDGRAELPTNFEEWASWKRA